ncbi:Glycosyltransferase 61 [Dillenia turbinata]|uniref:Glycosyltransferase 61 n=1 Tax=Dillenia turbinata TaxID=194707 RepID=A0AAN8V255_9MAGN
MKKRKGFGEGKSDSGEQCENSNEVDHCVTSTKLISCDRSDGRYDLCSVNGPNVLDPTISTFFASDPTGSTSSQQLTIEKIRPYPRKWENLTMPGIKEFILTSDPSGPRCKVQHQAPALVFSAGGYTGNFFHDFNDGFVPLFITVHSVFTSDQDFVLVIDKSLDWWVSKYKELLNAFSKHPIINLDKDNNTHCFPYTKIGLVSHGFMTIDPKLIPSSKTFIHFHEFLNNAYTQKNPITLDPHPTRPRLILASRSGNGGRVILNQVEVKQVIENLGFEVIVFEPTRRTPLSHAYELINSSQVMIGVHGAALTHLLFLRPRSVFMQIVPIGDEWVAEACFGKPAKAMELEYLEYRIGVEESSLIDEFGKDHVLLRDPRGLQKNGWSSEIMDIYLKKQNVKLDLGRFREYLKIAYKKAKKLKLEAMKTTSSLAILCCLLLFIKAFFIMKFNFWLFPKLSLANSISTQGTRHSDPLKGAPKDPIPSLPTQVTHVGLITCDRSHYHYDICSIKGPTVLDPTISTFCSVDPGHSKPSSPSIEKIKPYPRKWQELAMSQVKEVTLISSPKRPKCDVQHQIPALVFSTGGFIGNLWHDFGDGFIPLYVTVNTIFMNQEFVIVIDQSRDWWIHKYTDLLQVFSKHRIIRMNQETSTHCFPWAVIGLISHGFMTIEPKWLPNSKNIHHFHALLANIYGRNLSSISSINHAPDAPPRLALAGRPRGGVAYGRLWLNQDQVKRVAEEIGFEVIEFQPNTSTPMHENYAIISSSHALIGLHGAALTHLLFLRPGSVLLQIVPIGLDWLADVCYGHPAKVLGMDYMEYKIGVEESSLSEKYGKDDIVLKDPEALTREGWSKKLIDLYSRSQNVKLDMARFRVHLEEAYKRAKDFMLKQDQSVSPGHAKGS